MASAERGARRERSQGRAQARERSPGRSPPRERTRSQETSPSLTTADNPPDPQSVIETRSLPDTSGPANPAQFSPGQSTLTAAEETEVSATPSADDQVSEERPRGNHGSSSLTTVPSRDLSRVVELQAEPHDSMSARSADARLEAGPHSAQETPPDQCSEGGSSSIIEKIKARDFNSAAAKMDPDSADVKGLTCAVCLDIYNNPKFLPCHHTYCASCIQDLARRRHHKPFRCPSCRKEVTLPSGGVEALQHNFYIKPEDLEKAARGVADTSKCKSHPKQELDMYCTDCSKVVCFKCVLTKHKEHVMQDLADVADEAYHQLDELRDQLDNVIIQVEYHVNLQQQEQKDLESKMAAIKSNLQDRHDTIVAAAKKYLDLGMASVDKVMEEAQEAVVNDAKFAGKYLNTLYRLQKNIDTAIKTKAKVETVEAQRDMKEAVDELLSQRRTSVCRPVLRNSLPAVTTVSAVSDFFGQVSLMELELNEVDVDVVEKFHCGNEVDTEIFSICPKDNGTLSLSYARRNLNEHAPSEGFDDSGKHQYTRKEAMGRATWKSRGKGKGVFVGQLPGQTRTYSKGQNTETLLRLDNHLTGRADVKREVIVSENPYKSKLGRECSIKCGRHLAFDVDVSQTLYAVLEETGDPPQTCRKVLLFQKHKEDPVAVYNSSLPSILPSDVCFWMLDSGPVLLVADEYNDAIHVLDYQKDDLTFLKFLAPGSPLLVQPTALNVDVHNRLWVASRGGAVLMIEQKSSAIDQPAHGV